MKPPRAWMRALAGAVRGRPGSVGDPTRAAAPVTAAEAGPLAGAEGVVQLYRLLLGRDPEASGVVRDGAGRPILDILRAILESGEFRRKVLDPIGAGRRPRGDLFERSPGPDLAAWAADHLPLGAAGRAQAHEAGSSWVALYRAILLDDVLAAALRFGPDPEAAGLAQGFARLAETGAVQGEVEEMTAEAIRGWALDVEDTVRPLALQLFLDGRLAATATPDGFRRDVQDRFGGPGTYGFEIPLDPEGGAAGRHVELRESRSGVVIGTGTLTGSAPAVPLLRLQDDLAALRAGLARIEAALAPADPAGATPIGRYADYAALHYGPAGPGPGTAPRSGPGGPGPEGIAVVVDLAGMDLERASLAAESVLRSRRAPQEILFLTDPAADGPVLDDIVRRAGWSAPAPVWRLSVAGEPGTRWAAGLRTVGAPWAVILAGDRILSTDGLGTLASALAAAPESALVYGDEDSVDDEAPGRRVAPVFRSAFDADLLLQTPWIDGPVLVRVSDVLALGELAIGPAATAVSGLALALHGADRALTHVARVLATRTTGPAPDESGAWRAIVEAFLSGQDGPAAEIAPHRDPFVSLPGVLDIRFPTRLADASATVIIPTRDQPALLRDVLDSLEGARSANRVALSITVVDNGSVLPEALAELSRASGLGARVIRHEGPFNWALLNNKAAADASGNVLVFLNDDMRVIAPDWLDRLCELALRPDVGAVGTRLHYQDGTVQHAGILLRGEEASPIHEGVGARADDPGYGSRHALVRRVLAVTGACLATRGSVFREAGGFDSARYPVEANDVDYCLRLNDRGLKVLFTPHACLYHLESMSRGFSHTGEKRARSEESVRRLHERWDERFPSDPYFNAHLDRMRRPFAFLRPPFPMRVG